MNNIKNEIIKNSHVKISKDYPETFSIRLKVTTKAALDLIIEQNNLPATATDIVRYAIKAWIKNPSYTFDVKKLDKTSATSSKFINDDEII